MQILLRRNEQVLRQSYANHFIDHIGMVGKLFATNLRLYFVTNKLNYKHEELSIPLEDIASVTLKNNWKFFTHGLVIQLHTGAEHRFAVWRRKIWKNVVEHAQRSVAQERLHP